MARQSMEMLNAREELYGHKLTKSRVLRTILMYELIVFAYAFATYSIKNWIFILIWLALAAVYIYTYIIPRQIEFNYEARSEAERNRFINIITQGMTSNTSDIIKVLKMATDKANGEFKLDMQGLVATIMSANTYKAQHLAFKKVLNKYRNDYYFCRFMEEVETNVHESKYQMATYQAFKDHHNLTMTKEKEFEAKKKLIQQKMILMLVMVLIVACVALYSNGYKVFITVYATTVPGIICSTLFLMYVFTFAHLFFKRKFDTSVTSL